MRVTHQMACMAVQRLRTFTLTEFADEVGCSRSTARKAIDLLLERDTVIDTQERRKHGGPGRPAPVYAFNKPVGPHVPRRRETPPEVEAVQRHARFSRDTPSKGSRKKRVKVTNREVRKLTKAAQEAGWAVQRTNGGHLRAVSPDGEPVSLPSTPSDGRGVLNARAQLKRRGVAA